MEDPIFRDDDIKFMYTKNCYTDVFEEEVNTTSLWKAISQRPDSYPELTSDLEVDIAIIGGGITGITAAIQLIQHGKKIAIIEAGEIGGYTTAYSTGNLYIPVQPFYQKIAAKFNLATAKAIAHSRKFAIDYIEQTVQAKNIACNFARRPWYGYTADHERISLAKEVELFKQMEIPIEYVIELPLAFKFSRAVLIPDQARFNPLQYVISLAADLARQSCLIFENTRITNISEKDHCILTTEKAKITAQKVIIATHTPIGINSTQMFTAPYRSYVVAVHLKNLAYPEGHFWDLDRLPHATCTHAVSGNNPEILMVAGSHHKVGQSQDTHVQYQELENFLRERFPVAELAYQWSAQHYQSADYIPYIGLANHSAKHTYIATGYYADGLIYGTLAGMIISDMILDKQNPLRDIYQATRIDPLASAKFVLKENSNVLMQYLKDYPIFAAENYTAMKTGEGKVIEMNGEKFGVSRDAHNKLHIVSAVCTHMKCIVNWNTAEKTWDCPCHGSRFSCDGKVLEGPAVFNLAHKPQGT